MMYCWFALSLQMEFDYANEWIMHAKLCTTVATALLILLMGGAFGGSGLLCYLVGVACSIVSVCSLVYTNLGYEFCCLLNTYLIQENISVDCTSCSVELQPFSLN